MIRTQLISNIIDKLKSIIKNISLSVHLWIIIIIGYDWLQSLIFTIDKQKYPIINYYIKYSSLKLNFKFILNVYLQPTNQ